MVAIYAEKMLRLILMIFVVLVSSDVLCQSSDSVKCWSDKDKLKWSDFRGKRSENEDDYLKATSVIGMIPISFEKNKILCYKIKVVFRRYHSWKLDTAKHLLAHEQLHFDIEELTARKLRKSIQLIKASIPKPTEQDFDSVFEKFYLEEEKMQNEYDEQTYHGAITNTQLEWQKKISLELNKLKAYASTAEDCK